MKNFLKASRHANFKGFTLVELMVVVAIIGILSAIAIPNFRKYQAKSKTSEAKLQLSSIYTAETAFYTDYSTYATCIEVMGFEAPSAGSNYYAGGFDTDATQCGSDGACSSAPAICVDASPNSYDQTKQSGGTPIVSGSALNDSGVANLTSASAGSFTAGMAGTISASVATADIWSIDENKTVTHRQIGY